jgi:putative transposase
MTPEAVHYSQAKILLRQRAETLHAAFQANLMRFKGNSPQPPKLPDAAWINPPKKDDVAAV